MNQNTEITDDKAKSIRISLVPIIMMNNAIDNRKTNNTPKP